MSYEALGQAIRTARKKLRMSQEAFARKAGVSAKTIARIEQGKEQYEITPATLACIDAAAGWMRGSARAVYEGTGEPVPADTADTAATIEPAALLVWTAMQQDDPQEALEDVYARLATRMSPEDLRRVTERAAELQGGN